MCIIQIDPFILRVVLATYDNNLEIKQNSMIYLEEGELYLVVINISHWNIFWKMFLYKREREVTNSDVLGLSMYEWVNQINPSDAEVTSAQSTRMQRFLKTI